MKIHELIAESRVDEAPVGAIKQGLKKFGAKALAKVGAKDTAMGMAGEIDTGDEANKLRSEYQNYIGQSGQSMSAIDPADLSNWLKSKKYPTDGGLIPPSGVINKKMLDSILLKVVQASKKIKGAAGTATADDSTKDATAGAKDASATPQVDANKDGKDDKTGQPIAPVSGDNKGEAPPTGNGSAAGPAESIPANIQAQLDLLNSADKKRLASMI